MAVLRTVLRSLGGFAAVFFLFLGFRGVEVSAFVAAVLLFAMWAAAMDLLWQATLSIPRKAIASVAISGVCIGIWVVTEPPPEDRWIRVPYRATEDVYEASDGAPCRECEDDEFPLDDVGIMYVGTAGRGFVEMAFTDTPTLVLRDPQPGKVELPRRFRPPPDDPGDPVVEARTVDIPPGFKGTLKIRQQVGRVRFEVAGTRRHEVTLFDRAFAITLSRPSEAPTTDGRGTIYGFQFTVVEQ